MSFYRQAMALRHRLQLVNYTNAELLGKLRAAQFQLRKIEGEERKAGRHLFDMRGVRLVIFALQMELKVRRVGRDPADSLASEWDW